MDVTKILEADHQDVKDLFAKIEDAEGDERMALIQELATSLEAHMQLEEQVFYPAIKPVVDDEEVDEALTEHEVGRHGLEDVLALAPDEPGIDGALEACKAGVTHHTDEEEEDVFPELRNEHRDVLEAMATDFMKKRMELGLPMGAEALAAASTKEELLEEAKGAGVEGYSSMTKEELASALADVMAGSS